ncbi:MAG: FAD:protein FMN transferase [Gammaproteobacteria bacterium]|nr:FAD:protein FMN transferase [Gammaproteobacteria bacterium]
MRATVLLTLTALVACDRQVDPTELAGPTMGTQWSVVIVDEITDSSSESLRASIVAELARINALMSTYDEASQLSVFNHSRLTTPQSVHADTLRVVRQALVISQATEGAYDITLGPVIDLWGFGADPHSTRPSASALSSAMQSVGYQKLTLRERSLQKSRPGVQVDLSSIAKGFAVDRIGELLEAVGINNYLADIGGEIRTRGHRAPRANWRIGIEQPEGLSPASLSVSEAHIATSGSYRNYRLDSGKRYSHLIDGRTGLPIEHHLVAVTVLAESTMAADAWATAFMVVGPDQALRLANEHELAVVMTLADEEGQFFTKTSAMAEPFVVD